MSHEENPPPGMTGLAGHGPMASIKCVAQNHGLPGVQALALVGTSEEPASPTLFCNWPPTWYRQDPGAALSACLTDSELLKTKMAPFLFEKAEWGRPVSRQRNLGS